MGIVTLRNIHKVYHTGPEELPVLKGITADFTQGHITVVTGESGSGKSTLLNIIGGLDQPTKGEINSVGYEVNRLSEEELTEYRGKVIGFIFQFHYLLKDFSAVENIMLPALMRGSTKKEAREKAEHILQHVNLYDRKLHLPSQLSGGERQRIAVARSLINDPEIVLADEPTGNLDEKNSRKVEELLFKLVEMYGKTMVLVTHDKVLARCGNERFELDHGELVQTEQV